MKATAGTPMSAWIILGVVLAGYVSFQASQRAADSFGKSYDDTLYFSSAKALAEGRGYILPSVPGTIQHPIYPILYPALLSLVWRVVPAFPANIAPAAWLTALFGCGFLILSFYVLRRLGGLGVYSSLVIVGWCAFHPVFLNLSGSVLTDVPYAALAVGAIALADLAMRRESGTEMALATAITAGLTVHMRTVGVAAVAGILAIGLARRAFRQALIFALGVSPFLAAAFWLVHTSHEPSVATAASERGWQLTSAAYTSYWTFWRLSVPNFHSFLRLFRLNATLLVVQPGRYLVAPTVEATSQPGALLCIVLFVGCISGLVRQVFRYGLKPFHTFLVFQCGILLVWHAPAMTRYLLVFLPLFFAGIWLEGKNVASLILRRMRSRGPLYEKVLAGSLGCSIVALAGVSAWNYVRGARPEMSRSIREYAAAQPEKKKPMSGS